MLQFLKRICQFFIDSKQSDLERYIARHNPQNAADLEHILVNWARKSQGGWL